MIFSSQHQRTCRWTGSLASAGSIFKSVHHSIRGCEVECMDPSYETLLKLPKTHLKGRCPSFFVILWDTVCSMLPGRGLSSMTTCPTCSVWGYRVLSTSHPLFFPCSITRGRCGVLWIKSTIASSLWPRYPCPAASVVHLATTCISVASLGGRLPGAPLPKTPPLIQTN